MKNYQQGFVLIQILVAILTGIAVVSGTAFVAYEAGQESSEDSSQSITATRYLNELEKEGRVKQVGATGHAVYYVPVK